MKIPIPFTESKINNNIANQPRKFRWVIDINKWDISIQEEVMFLEYENPSFHTGGRYFSFGFRNWRLAYDSTYWNGEHRSLNLGFIYFSVGY